MTSLMDQNFATQQGTWHVTSVEGPTLEQPQITVSGYYPNRGGATTRAAQTEIRKSAIARAPADVSASMPIVVEDGEPAETYVTRSTDGTPYWAGGMIKGANGAGCTSGFAIRYGGVNHTTTARHCVSTPYTAWDNKNSSYGSTSGTSSTGLARALSGTGAARMFDGAWNNSSGFNKVVVGSSVVAKGALVCSSGANSGVHCNLQVDNTAVAFNDGYGSATTVRVKQLTSGQIAGAHGDSGGPIFTLDSSDKVYAVGMLQGSLETQITNCGSLRLAQPCSVYIEYSPINTIVSSLGAVLLT